MTLSREDIERLAAHIDDAAQKATPVPMLTATQDFTLEEAYVIQRASMALRAARGDGLVGMKMGLTSLAKMQQMGVHDPIYGHLTASMRLSDGDAIAHAAHVHPRVEPEIAFILGRDLRGPTTAAEAMLAVEGVCAALEVIDSRYTDFKFTLRDVVADNASSSHFVLGNTLRRPDALDLSNLGMVMEQNGVAAQIGSSAAILEHPARSLATLANLVGALGETLKAGQIILAGAATAAVPVQEGDTIRARVHGLGSVTLNVR